MVRYLLVALAAVCICAPASGATRIQFDATSSISGPSGGFVVDVGTRFLGQLFSPAEMESCYVQSGWTCAGGYFGGGGGGGYDTVQFSARNDATGAIVGLIYFFAPGSFYTPGTYDSLLFPDQAGVLAISSVPGRGTFGAIPEPATWSMMLLGFLLIGCVIRRMSPQPSSC